MTQNSNFKQRVRALAKDLGIPYAEARTRLLNGDTLSPPASLPELAHRLRLAGDAAVSSVYTGDWGDDALPGHYGKDRWRCIGCERLFTVTSTPSSVEAGQVPEFQHHDGPVLALGDRYMCERCVRDASGLAEAPFWVAINQQNEVSVAPLPQWRPSSLPDLETRLTKRRAERFESFLDIPALGHENHVWRCAACGLAQRFVAAWVEDGDGGGEYVDTGLPEVQDWPAIAVCTKCVHAATDGAGLPPGFVCQ